MHWFKTQQTQQQSTEGDVPFEGLYFVVQTLSMLLICVISSQISVHFIPLVRIIERFLVLNVETKKQNMLPNLIVIIMFNAGECFLFSSVFKAAIIITGILSSCLLSVFNQNIPSEVLSKS